MAADDGRPRQAIVVLGMHRSGSSAMTRVISLLGAQLPAKLMPAYTHNTPGHWEPQEVADLNDAFLLEVGSRWDAPFGPGPSAVETLATPVNIDRARAVLAANYRGDSDIVLKEPRVAVLHAIWSEALKAEGFQLRYIIMVRPPQEVTASLRARDGMPTDFGLLLWTTYMLESERVTRGQPRVFVAFDRLLANPEHELNRVEAALTLDFSKRRVEALDEIKSFLDPQHRHEIAADCLLPRGLEKIAPLIQFVNTAATDGPTAAGDVDTVRAWMTRLNEQAGPLISRAAFDAQAHAKSERATGLSTHGSEHQIQTLNAELNERIKQAEDQAERIALLEETLSARISQAEFQQESLRRMQAEIDRQAQVTATLHAALSEASNAHQSTHLKLLRVEERLDQVRSAYEQRISDLCAAHVEQEALVARIGLALREATAARRYWRNTAENLRDALADGELKGKAERAEAAARLEDIRSEAEAAVMHADHRSRAAAAMHASLEQALLESQRSLAAADVKLADSETREILLQQELDVIRAASDRAMRESKLMAARLFDAEHRSTGWLVRELGRRMTARRAGEPRE